MAEGFADFRQRPESGWQFCFEVGFDRAGQHGGGTLGPDGHHNGIAVHDGGGDELAVGKVIDDVDQCALGCCDGGGAGVFGGVFIGAIEKGCANGVAVCPSRG